MAKANPGTVQDVLFTQFLAPLVLGGPMTLHKPIGGATALAMEGDRPFADPELGSHVQLARVRIARALAPIDRLEALTGHEWALAAVLNDLIQTTHPGFDAMLRRSSPGKLLGVLDATLDRIPNPSSVGESLSRHTLFSRVLEVTRTDVTLAWWTGKQTFLGTEPPARLKAWPELRRVEETRLPRGLVELPGSGGVVSGTGFLGTLSKFLERTPLTDLATLDRKEPAFQWSAGSLGLVGSRGGRTLALRAIAHRPPAASDDALGAATRRLAEGRQWQGLGVALDLLGEHILTRAVLTLSRGGDAVPLAPDKDGSAAGFTRSVGAFSARRLIATSGGGLDAEGRQRVLALLGPAAESGAAQSLAALLAG